MEAKAPGEASDLARKTAELAARDIGIREKGKNAGKRIEQYQATVGLKKGQPYCIAAVCTWIKEACRELQVDHEMLFSPSCMRFLDYAKKCQLYYPASELAPEMLPCVGVVDHGKGLGHAFLIVGMDSYGDLVTIEANTDGSGSREGDGVYNRTDRKVSQLAGVVRIA